MKIVKVKSWGRGKIRSVQYEMPSKLGLLYVYYYGTGENGEPGRMVWFMQKSPVKEKKKKDGTPSKRKKRVRGYLIRPRLYTNTDGALAMIEALLVRLITNYRLPRGVKPRGSFGYLAYMWKDILDKYFGIGLTEAKVYLDYDTVKTVLREIDDREHA